MPRAPRIDVPGLPQHLIVRGNNRSTLFFSDRDCQVFLRYLEEGLAATGCKAHAFVLMPNHVHLLATAQKAGGVSRLIQAIGRRYARFINRAYSRTGTLFEGRFRSSLVDSERYFLTCMRYIESNPVRATLVPEPARFPWSSYAQNATGRPAWMLTPHEEYLRLGSDAHSRGAAYRALFCYPMGSAELEQVRIAAAKGAVLGGEAFANQVSDIVKRPLARESPGRPPRSPTKPGEK
jgi:putative transposase